MTTVQWSFLYYFTLFFQVNWNLPKFYWLHTWWCRSREKLFKNAWFYNFELLRYWKNQFSWKYEFIRKSECWLIYTYSDVDSGRVHVMIKSVSNNSSSKNLNCSNLIEFHLRIESYFLLRFSPSSATYSYWICWSSIRTVSLLYILMYIPIFCVNYLR